MTYGDIDKYQDIMDSRDVISRIEDLEAIIDDEDSDPDDVQEANEELGPLREFAQEGADNIAEWPHGEALIRDSYFERYAEEWAEDVCDMEPADRWPFSHIDWEAAAAELKMDYTSLYFHGVTYWARRR